MASAIKLSKKDVYLVALGVIISFMIQSIFDVVHEAQVYFNFDQQSIFIGSIFAALIFTAFFFIFSRNLESKISVHQGKTQTPDREIRYGLGDIREGLLHSFGNKIQQHERVIAVFSTIIIITTFILVWLASFYFGYFNFNKSNADLIYSSIIAGMSALLSIILAVSIFRIQSLENRIMSIEQSTLDYVFNITGLTYPCWCDPLEKQIKDKVITDRYFCRRRADKIVASKEDIVNLEKDRDDQQDRLSHNLTVHTNLRQVIRKMKLQITGASIFLIIPIAFSFLLLMSSNSLSDGTSFFLVSLMVYLSVIGIGFLVLVVVQSMLHQAGN